MHRTNIKLLLLTATSLSSCTNTGFIGHRVGYDINAEIKPDLSAPVAFNMGFESHSAVAVPPERSLLPTQLTFTNNVPEGDVLSTISRLSVERLTGSTGAEHDFVTASGDAAENVTKGSSLAGGVKAAAATGTPTDAATQIATTGDSIEEQ
ncbi:hypothetical protein [Luteolibacter sp. AS25]|uniref:hypothetical protein n=1 Tax=Luteolibacter sp. AS25 TaxID=3135776 RepID=UPI00398B61B2